MKQHPPMKIVIGPTREDLGLDIDLDVDDDIESLGFHPDTQEWNENPDYYLTTEELQ